MTGSPHKGPLMRNAFPCNDVIMVKQLCIESCTSIMLLQWAIHLEISFDFSRPFRWVPNPIAGITFNLYVPEFVEQYWYLDAYATPMDHMNYNWTIMCWTLGTNFNEIVKIQRFPFQNALNMLYANCRQFCFIFGVLNMYFLYCINHRCVKYHWHLF